MPIETVFRNTKSSLSQGRQKPVTTKWQGVWMIRKHSFNASVKEIVTFSNTQDFTKIGLIGDQDSGKTTLALALAHQIHTLSKVPFSIRIFTQKELLNFEETLKTLSPTNQILIFDDISFLSATASKKDLDKVKQAITKIRHLEGGQDVKIITIMNYHYSLGLDKYLRQTDFKFFTSVGSSENDNVENMIGSKYSKLIKDFQKKRYTGITKKKYPFRIGSKETFVYRYRDPFIVVLFHTPNSTRMIISPTREWLQEICSKCSEANGSLIVNDIPIDQFMKECEEKFGVGAWKSCIKLALFSEGMTTYNNNVVRALKYLNKCRSTKKIKLESCAIHYNLTVKQTRLRSKLDGVMEK